MAATGRHPRAPDLHPDVLQTVELTVRPTVGDPVVHRSKVLDVEVQDDGTTTVVIACPEAFDPLEHHFGASVAWTYPLGRMECPVTTSPGRRPYGRVWLLRPAGPATRFQQRNYFRAVVSVPVLLTWTLPAAEDDQAAEESGAPSPLLSAGMVADISEGGLLAVLRGRAPDVGTEVESAMRIEDDEVVQAATVVRHVLFPGGGTGVALAFADPRQHGDTIRRFAFAAERRRRLL